MEFIIADKAGRELFPLSEAEAEFDLNEEKDFRITIQRENWKKGFDYGNQVFFPNTEIGGIIGEVSTDTSVDEIYLSGYTWRGLLCKKIIMPSPGSSYRSVSGELNQILKDIIEPEFNGFFQVSSEDTGAEVINYRFMPYITMLDGIVEMLKSAGFRLDISYLQGNPNEAGYVRLSAEKIVDYSEEIELSEDTRLDFAMTEKKNGINHLICVSKEQEGTLFHVYVQEDGTIGKQQYYTGIDEIAAVYENTSADAEEAEQEAYEKLTELMNRKSFGMNVEELEIDGQIGDLIGGRDYLTGMYAVQPIQNIIVDIKDNIITKEYKLEGEDS